MRASPLRLREFDPGISLSPCMRKWCSFIEGLPAEDAEVLILVAAVVLWGVATKCVGVCRTARRKK